MIIDVQRHPKEVINDIKQCENVISSSLHGLVTADSFGIPSLMFVNPRTMPKRGDKYEDYYSSLGMNEQYIELSGDESIGYFLSKTNSKTRFVDPVKMELNECFSGLLNYIKTR